MILTDFQFQRFFIKTLPEKKTVHIGLEIYYYKEIVTKKNSGC